MSTYTFAASLPQPLDEVRTRVDSALKSEGFGVLTEIDVAATLKAKLGHDHAPYLILGACNPQLAERALEIDPSIGALLPCNVVLRQSDERGTIVEIVDPVVALGLVGALDLAPVAVEAAARLRRVLDALAGSDGSGPGPEPEPEARSSAQAHPSLR
jgi:uncharacterized protein (DUF302 family)